MSDLIRVLSRSETIRAVGLSRDTWERMELRGETPPLIQLSKRRIGYRLSDIKEWLDKRASSFPYASQSD